MNVSIVKRREFLTSKIFENPNFLERRLQKLKPADANGANSNPGRQRSCHEFDSKLRKITESNLVESSNDPENRDSGDSKGLHFQPSIPLRTQTPNIKFLGRRRHTEFGFGAIPQNRNFSLLKKSLIKNGVFQPPGSPFVPSLQGSPAQKSKNGSPGPSSRNFGNSTFRGSQLEISGSMGDGSQGSPLLRQEMQIGFDQRRYRGFSNFKPQSQPGLQNQAQQLQMALAARAGQRGVQLQRSPHSKFSENPKNPKNRKNPKNQQNLQKSGQNLNSPNTVHAKKLSQAQNHPLNLQNHPQTPQTYQGHRRPHQSLTAIKHTPNGLQPKFTTFTTTQNHQRFSMRPQNAQNPKIPNQGLMQLLRQSGPQSYKFQAQSISQSHNYPASPPHKPQFPTNQPVELVSHQANNEASQAFWMQQGSVQGYSRVDHTATFNNMTYVDGNTTCMADNTHILSSTINRTNNVTMYTFNPNSGADQAEGGVGRSSGGGVEAQNQLLTEQFLKQCE